jgi:hypothetical protein
MDAPKHAFEITLQVGANDWESAKHVLLRLADHAASYGPDTGNMITAGAGQSGHVAIERRDVTPEQHAAELEAYLEAEHARETCVGEIVDDPNGTPLTVERSR